MRIYKRYSFSHNKESFLLILLIWLKKMMRTKMMIGTLSSLFLKKLMINILQQEKILLTNAKGSKKLLQARMTKPHPMNEESVENLKIFLQLKQIRQLQMIHQMISNRNSFKSHLMMAVLELM